MTAQRDDRVLAAHATSVVGDRNESESAALDFNREVVRAGIEGVFD